METIFDKYKNIIFEKYSDEEILKDINNFQKKSGHLYKLLNHFFEEALFKCKSNKYQKSPWEALHSEEDMKWILDYIKSKPNFYNSKNEKTNIKSFFRNSPRIARKVANFDVRAAKNIYDRYSENKSINILDMCSGFGSRGAAALLSGHSYTGIDANSEVVDCSNRMLDFLKKYNLISKEGHFLLGDAAILNKDLINNFDLMFTSPPYFNLETYANDNFSSTTNYNNYNNWLEEFIKPLINNTYLYLKENGLLLLNIKNLTNKGKEPLFDDIFKMLLEDKRFKFVEIFDYKVNKRFFFKNTSYSEGAFIAWKEPIMVFQKIK